MNKTDKYSIQQFIALTNIMISSNNIGPVKHELKTKHTTTICYLYNSSYIHYSTTYSHTQTNESRSTHYSMCEHRNIYIYINQLWMIINRKSHLQNLIGSMYETKLFRILNRKLTNRAKYAYKHKTTNWRWPQSPSELTEDFTNHIKA